MKERRKLWIGLGTALIATGIMGAHAMDPATQSGHAGHKPLHTAALGGEGGEGGEGDATVDLALNDVAYLGQLGLVRGHLWVGLQLYKNGHRDMARTHMKHPGDELYSDMVPAMEARGFSGFADELTALGASVSAGEPVATVERDFAALDQAIAQVENLHGADLKTILLSIEYMVRTAADEYTLGVKDGAVVNAHEYQDALGFTQVARLRLEQLTKAQRAAGPGAIADVRSQLEQIDTLWPELLPQDRVNGDASLLYGAAARIQLAASDLD